MVSAIALSADEDTVDIQLVTDQLERPGVALAHRPITAEPQSADGLPGAIAGVAGRSGCGRIVGIIIDQPVMDIFHLEKRLIGFAFCRIGQLLRLAVNLANEARKPVSRPRRADFKSNRGTAKALRRQPKDLGVIPVKGRQSVQGILSGQRRSTIDTDNRRSRCRRSASIRFHQLVIKRSCGSAVAQLLAEIIISILIGLPCRGALRSAGAVLTGRASWAAGDELNRREVFFRILLRSLPDHRVLRLAVLGRGRGVPLAQNSFGVLKGTVLLDVVLVLVIAFLLLRQRVLQLREVLLLRGLCESRRRQQTQRQDQGQENAHEFPFHCIIS